MGATAGPLLLLSGMTGSVNDVCFSADGSLVGWGKMVATGGGEVNWLKSGCSSTYIG